MTGRVQYDTAYGEAAADRADGKRLRNDVDTIVQDIVNAQRVEAGVLQPDTEKSVPGYIVAAQIVVAGRSQNDTHVIVRDNVAVQAVDA